MGEFLMCFIKIISLSVIGGIVGYFIGWLITETFSGLTKQNKEID